MQLFLKKICVYMGINFKNTKLIVQKKKKKLLIINLKFLFRENCNINIENLYS